MTSESTKFDGLTVLTLLERRLRRFGTMYVISSACTFVTNAATFQRSLLLSIYDCSTSLICRPPALRLTDNLPCALMRALSFQPRPLPEELVCS